MSQELVSWIVTNDASQNKSASFSAIKGYLQLAQYFFFHSHSEIRLDNRIYVFFSYLFPASELYHILFPLFSVIYMKNYNEVKTFINSYSSLIPVLLNVYFCVFSVIL